MRRVLYILVLGLVGAVIAHIAIVLLVPEMSSRDSWSKLAAAAEPYVFARVTAPAGEMPLVRAAGPLFEAAACRFDLDDAPLHVATEGRVPYWSVAVYDRSGRDLYSFSDRSAIAGLLDLVVVTSPQLAELRQDLPEALEGSVFVEANITEGIVVMRVFVPDESWRPAVLAFLASATCGPA